MRGILRTGVIALLAAACVGGGAAIFVEAGSVFVSADSPVVEVGGMLGVILAMVVWIAIFLLLLGFRPRRYNGKMVRDESGC